MYVYIYVYIFVYMYIYIKANTWKKLGTRPNEAWLALNGYHSVIGLDPLVENPQE